MGLILHKTNERRYHCDAIQANSIRSVSDTDEVVGQFLNDGNGLRLLDRGDVFGNQDGLLRFDKDTSIRLISLAPVDDQVRV